MKDIKNRLELQKRKVKKLDKEGINDNPYIQKIINDLNKDIQRLKYLLVKEEKMLNMTVNFLQQQIEFEESYQENYDKKSDIPKESKKRLNKLKKCKKFIQNKIFK